MSEGLPNYDQPAEKVTRFFVEGDPVPKGSVKVWKNKFTGKVWSAPSNNEKLKPWEYTIRTACPPDLVPTMGSVYVELFFFFPRPKGHYGKKGLRAGAPYAMTTKPDCDKLARCALDSLKGIAYRDDAQVDVLKVAKFYCDLTHTRPGMGVVVTQRGE